jgi:hypothetical protein
MKKNKFNEFFSNKNNVWAVIVVAVGAILAILSYTLLPETIGTQISSGVLNNMMSRNTVITAEFLLTLTAVFMYQRNGYSTRLLILGVLGDVLALLILILNLVFA